MPTIQAIVDKLHLFAPPQAAESYDNVGLLVGYPQQEATGALINLDVTEAVLQEAKDLNINLIVTHHPVWFMPRKRLIADDYVSRIIMQAVKWDISLVAVHTNLDNVRTGVNHKIAQTLGLQNVLFLENKTPLPTHALGSGMIGDLAEPMHKLDFLQLVKDSFGCGGIRYADTHKPKVQKVAVCGGSGAFLIGAARREGADAFVTADVTYHKFFDNENDLLLLDIGHYESEQFTSELLFAYISKNFPNFAARLSEVRTNPVRYF